MIMFRRIITPLVIITVIFVMTLSAFGAESVMTEEMTGSDFRANVNLSISNTSVRPGDRFTVTIGIDNIENADTALRGVYRLFLFERNSSCDTVFDFDNMVVTLPENLSVVSNSFTRGGYLEVRPNDYGQSIVNDFNMAITLKVKEDAALQTWNLVPEFRVMMNETNIVEFTPVSLNITDSTSDPGDGETESPSYTISPVVTDTAKHVGETFTVSAVVTADQADAGLAAVDAMLNYDEDLVKPVGASTVTLTEGSAGYYGDGETGITTDGTGKINTWGSSTQVGDSGVTVATYTFEAITPGDAVFSIADGAKVGQSGNSADIAATAGESVTVTISEAPEEIGLISNNIYKGAPDGFQILRYAANALPAEENAYFYGEDTTPLFYAGQNEDGKYVFLGFVGNTLTEVSPESVQEKSGTYCTLAHDGDINLNEEVNAIDSLIAYDLSIENQTYLADSAFAALPMQSRLEADVNNDGVVSADDARAAMYKALGIIETVTEPAA